MDDIFSLVDIAVFGCGFYAFYCAWVLDTKLKIIPLFLLGKDQTEQKCTDIPGYASFMSPRLKTLAMVMIAYGGLSLLNTYLVPIGGLVLVGSIGFFAVLVWYGIQTRKAEKLFFTP